MSRLATVFYRLWWPVLDLGRLVVRTGVERWRTSWVWPIGMAVRLLLHHAIASPWFVVAGTLIAWRPARSSVIVAAFLVAAIEAALRVGERLSRLAVRVMCWRRGLVVRRRFPRLWADYAGRTKRVQAETGKEPSTPVRWRPMVDHPRISWLMRTDVDQASVGFTVGPPPDRTFAEFAVALPALAARLPWVYSIELDFESERSSFGDLRVYFADPLATAVESDWDDLADESEEVEQW
ncbi:MAG: hypothetical protein WBM50_03610 [Acidimicrobiales bacterium]